ncbi:MAG: transglutaminase-like domain-containing protein [bacterium]
MKNNKYDKWLKGDAITQTSPLIKKMAKKFKGDTEIGRLFNLHKWLKKQKYQKVDDNIILKREFFRKRNAHQIIADGYFTGCSDYSIVAAVLLRELGIPTKIVQVVNMDWLKGKPSKLVGHILLEIYIYDRWLIFDSFKGLIGFDYSFLNFVVYKKGADILDIGIRTLDELRPKLDDFRKEWQRKNKKMIVD